MHFCYKQKKSKTHKTAIPNKIIYLELLHQKLGHRSTRSLLSGETADVWKYIDNRVYPDPLCASCQISTINKQPISKIPLNTKIRFKWVFMEIILDLSSKRLTKETKFTHNILIVDAYSKLPRIYGIEKITTEEVIDKLENIQSRFGKVYKFGR